MDKLTGIEFNRDFEPSGKFTRPFWNLFFRKTVFKNKKNDKLYICRDSNNDKYNLILYG
jgi:hypothetical protein